MKKLIALVLALVCVLGLVGCSDKNMTFDIETANKINIKSGLTGDEVNIADNEFIQSITENINSLRFEKTSATDGKVGYAYMLTWFDTEDNQIARITITDENGYQIGHDGYYYKVGADLCIDTELIDEMLNIALSSTPATKQLTLEKVMELSTKGEELTWSDFEQYAYEDIGSGLYIYRYDIDSDYELRITGSPSVEPMHIRLISKANQDNYIDIRTESVSDFIKGEPLEIEGISQEKAEEIALEQCKVNYDYIKTAFNSTEKRWYVEFWENMAKDVATQTVLIDTEGNVLGSLYAE